jgi:hypothetical protein
MREQTYKRPVINGELRIANAAEVSPPLHAPLAIRHSPLPHPHHLRIWYQRLANPCHMVFHDDGKAKDKCSGYECRWNVSFMWNDFDIESEGDYLK